MVSYYRIEVGHRTNGQAPVTKIFSTQELDNDIGQVRFGKKAGADGEGIHFNGTILPVDALADSHDVNKAHLTALVKSLAETDETKRAHILVDLTQREITVSHLGMNPILLVKASGSQRLSRGRTSVFTLEPNASFELLHGSNRPEIGKLFFRITRLES